jgi:hypothetical protein
MNAAAFTRNAFSPDATALSAFAHGSESNLLCIIQVLSLFGTETVKLIHWSDNTSDRLKDPHDADPFTVSIGTKVATPYSTEILSLHSRSLSHTRTYTV